MVMGFNNDKGTKLAEQLGVVSKNFSDCGFCKSRGELKLYVPWDIWQEWQWITKKMGGKEWGAVYDVKHQEMQPAENGTPAVTGDVVLEYRLPKQIVSSTECEFKEELGGNGVVHSHHTMGAFHSSQDDKQSRNLYDWSIVLASNGVECSKREKLPCGGFGYVKATVFLLGCPDIDLSVIKEETYGYTSPTYSSPNGLDDTEDTDRIQGALPFHQRKRGVECKACLGTGISDEQTICTVCNGDGHTKDGEAKDEILESDVAFRCNACHKFFELPNMGLCPVCNSPNWRKSSNEELKAIEEGRVCKKCPEVDCAGCPLEIPDIIGKEI